MALGKHSTITEGNYRTYQEEVAGALDDKEYSLVEPGTADNTVKLNTVAGNESGVMWKKLQAATGKKDDVNVRSLNGGGTSKAIQNAAINYGAKIMADPAAPTKVIAVPTTAPALVADGVTTNGSPTVTSATAKFGAGDVGKPISGTGIPASSFIGVVNSSTSIGLSSSQSANTPANATATATGVTLTILDRSVHYRSIGRKVSQGGGAQNDVIEFEAGKETIVVP